MTLWSDIRLLKIVCRKDTVLAGHNDVQLPKNALKWSSLDELAHAVEEFENAGAK